MPRGRRSKAFSARFADLDSFEEHELAQSSTARFAPNQTGPVRSTSRGVILHAR